MRTFVAVLILTGLMIAVAATPASRDAPGARATVLPGHYIVWFDSNAGWWDTDDLIAEFEATYPDLEVTIRYSLGFSGKMSEETAAAIAQDPCVGSMGLNVLFRMSDWGDANCDGPVNALDAVDVLRSAAGLGYRPDIACRPAGVTDVSVAATVDPLAERYFIQFDPDEVTDVDAAMAQLSTGYDIDFRVAYYRYANHSDIRGFSGLMTAETAQALSQDARILWTESDSSNQATWGDANCDGSTDLLDALDVLRYAARTPFRTGIACTPID